MELPHVPKVVHEENLRWCRKKREEGGTKEAMNTSGEAALIKVVQIMR